MWCLLLVTLPTRPNAVRLRVWRSLRQLGCAALRDGAYLLPQAQVGSFEALADEVRAHAGTATVLTAVARGAAQEQEWLALFDRSAAYAEWREQAQALRRELPRLGAAELSKRLREIEQALAAVQRTDHLPGAAAAQALQEREALRQAVAAQLSPGEPRAGPQASIARLSARDFQGRRWATRERPGVDRLACAWLIRRFIDPAARFLWLADPTRLPRGAVGFDFDGARFTHVGVRVSFEVLAASFALHHDSALARIGLAVRYLDVGGIPVAEAAGLGAVLAGLGELHVDDDALVAAAAPVFDAWYAAPSVAP